MQELSGYTYFTVTAKLIFKGFKFYREINSDTEDWINPLTCKIFRINKSSDYVSEDDLLSILNQAGISLEKFLSI